MLSTNDKIIIRLLEEKDLVDADRILRLAFGTFLGLPDPEKFMGDAGYVQSRWRTDPPAAFAAELNGELAGSNFATTWGSVGFFGPLTIRPDLWDRGLGARLMEPIIELFAKRNVRQAGLYTFAQSKKHVGLYQKFGFWPRFLTAILSRPVDERPRERLLEKGAGALSEAELLALVLRTSCVRLLRIVISTTRTSSTTRSTRPTCSPSR